MERELVMTPGFARPDELLRILGAAEDAMLCLVGPQLQLFERYFGARAFPGVLRVHFAGGPFPAAEREALAARFPRARIFNNYGCAEAMPRLTLRADEPTDAAGGASAADIGRPLPGVELRLGPEGDLRFRSPYSAVAFFEQERLELPGEETWISTGDLAQQAPDGHWELLGRRDQVFKRYGEKVALGRLLETVARAFGGQGAFYRERDRMNEEGAVLVLAPRPTDEEVRAIQRALRAGHPRAHWPLRLESVERLPQLPNGKIDLSALASLEGKSVHWRNRV